MKNYIYKVIVSMFIILLLFYNVFAIASTNNEDRTVKIGLIDIDEFNCSLERDSNECYGYEYLEHLARYVNWRFEYVKNIKNIDQAIDMLENGQIDMICPYIMDNLKKDNIYLSEYPICERKYILTVDENSKKYYQGDVIYLDNINIGVIENDENNKLYEEFAKNNGLKYNFTYYSSIEKCRESLYNGEIEAIFSSDMRNFMGEKIILTLDYSKMFLAISNENEDLKKELNLAIYKLKENEANLDNNLYFKYFRKKYNDYPNFTRNEVDFILNNSNRKFRIGYDSNNLPFSFHQEGETKGIYIYGLEKLQDISEIKFELVALDMYNLLEKKTYGEIFIDNELSGFIGFPQNLNLANENNLIMSDELISFSVAEITHADSKTKTIGLIGRDDNILEYILMKKAIIKGMNGKSIGLIDNMELYKDRIVRSGNIVKYEDIDTCVEGFRKNEIDAIYVDEYSGQIIKNKLGNMEYNFFIEKFADIKKYIAISDSENSKLISIINKSIYPWIENEMQDSANQYIMNLKRNVNFEDYWNDNHVEIVAFLVFLIIMIIVIIVINKKHYLELEKINKKLIVASNAKSDFLANMSHELRTPLNSIIGLNTLLKDALNNKDEAEEYVNKIDTSSKMLLNIINDILDMSAIESGKLKLFNENFNIKEEIFAITTIYYLQCKRKNIKFEVETSDIIEETLFGDSYRLRQIVLNLISNAFKFTESGGNIFVQFRQEKKDENHIKLFIRVRDSGCGMTDELMNRLFDKFEQEDASTVREHGGSGLGLAITKSIVDLMDGQITVTSKKNVGSDFLVTIPMKIGLAKKSIEKKYIPHEFDKMNVLIVDDNRDTCKYISSIVGKWNMNATYFTSAIDSLKSVKLNIGTEKEYNLFIIDIRMPELNGIELSKELRKIVKSDDIILLISGYDITEYRDQVEEIGVNKFLQKPIFKSELYNSIIEAIDENDKILEKEELDEELVDLSGLSVLLVEDNEINRIIAKKLLTRVGVDVVEAANGKEALQHIVNELVNFDVVLMDIQMPLLNGYDATKKIRSLNTEYARSLLIYAMTANTFQRDIDKCMEAGMNGHIGKPIEIYRLYSILNKIREEKRKEG